MPENRLPTAKGFLMYLVWTYVWGSLAAVAVMFVLVALGLEFTGQQWLDFLLIAFFVVPGYTLPDLYLIWRHVQPVTRVLETLGKNEKSDTRDVSKAIVCTLNLPFYAFLRVTLFHGPMATIFVGIGMYLGNRWLDSGWADWQITTWLDNTQHLDKVQKAMLCHKSQLPGYHPIDQWPLSELARIFGTGHLYRAFSLVNGGRKVERDLFEGLR